MDVFSHALASVAVVRVAIPRAPRAAWLAALVAGAISDIDSASSLFGPSAYLTWHHAYTHSIGFAVVAAALFTIVSSFLIKNTQTKNSAMPTTATSTSLIRLFAVLFLVALVHLALDAFTSDPITAFWPFSSRRIAAGYLPSIDPYIIAVLLAALLLPELLHLVSSEIGSKSKAPRGRHGALIAIAIVALYIATRAALHSNAAVAIDSRTYRNESPRHSAIFPDSTSLTTWHGIVETVSALHEFTINALSNSSDPENLSTLFKPDPNPALDAARNSASAKKFLASAQFPKATLQKTQEGYEVQLRDLRHTATNDTGHEVIVVIHTDPSGRVLQDELAWGAEQTQPNHN